jgi:hypothetical protein
LSDIAKTKIGFFKAIHLVLLAIFSPKDFELIEAGDMSRIKKLKKQEISRIRIIRRAMFWSFIIVSISFIIGFFIALLLNILIGKVNHTVIVILQILGGLIILWATLFLRGWDIQTFVGTTLSERVNSWIYRFAYCLGTIILVISFFLQSN